LILLIPPVALVITVNATTSFSEAMEVNAEAEVGQEGIVMEEVQERRR
jgi:hypothetical protein